MPDDPSGLIWRLRITGRVQGVGYRAWCVHTALDLGLRGWVRNVTDGSVEVTAQGPKAALDDLVRAAKAGPPAAQVLDVRHEDVTASAGPLSPGFHQSGTHRL